MQLSREQVLAIKQRCREWRLDNRYTMSAVAALSGVSRPAVNGFEHGSGITVRILSGYIALGMPRTLILDAAGISFEDLFNEVVRDGKT